MARQTRSQRRARREKQAESAVAKRAPARQQQVRPAPAQAPKSQTGARRVPGSGSRRFVSESWAELRKVEWPGQGQVMQGTVVVIIACAIVGAYLYGADLLLQPIVRDWILRQ
jgi:preprotein translocase subunit SecE